MGASKNSADGSVPAPSENALPSRLWQPKVFIQAFGAYVLLWFSFPPVAWSPLAWLALVPLIGLVLAPSPLIGRPYWKLYFAGLLYWLATFYFVPIPHPALWAGWAAVSLYMAIYTPLTIAASRLLVHRWTVPPAIAVPIVWVGVEWIRCHFATGMGMVCLSHSQAKFPAMIQFASIGGSYAVTFLMVMVATCLAIAWRRWRNLGNWVVGIPSGERGMNWPVALGVAIALFVSNLGFGLTCLNQSTNVVARPMADGVKSEKNAADSEETLNVGLVQTNFDAVFAAQSMEDLERRFYDVVQLTNRAVREKPDLVVWPESGFFPYRWQLEDVTDQQSASQSEDLLRLFWGQAVGSDRFGGTPLLSGVLAQNYPMNKVYNSAVLIDSQGKLQQRYDKNHPVMFGEYIPFAKIFPLLEDLAPMTSIEFGNKFQAYEINGFTIAPNICFETTISHLIRRQIDELANRGIEPDVMVNLTNDGWFFGTACLDHHLACNIFRAVELRKTNLVCANTGLSAHIDPYGRLIAVGPRRRSEVLQATVRKHAGGSVYRVIGDLFPCLFGWTSLVVLGLGRGRPKPVTSD